MIQQAPKHKSVAQLAREFGVSERTILRWRNREDVFDRPHTPHNLKTSLSEIEQEIVIELRKTLLLTLDDLLRVVHEFINPKCSRSALYRCLKRHGVANLNTLVPQDEANNKPKKTFKDYLPGYIHVDIKYLPKMLDKDKRYYLFVAIDRASRWVFMAFYPNKSAESASNFLKKLVRKAPFTIEKILTDNGKEFTDRFSLPDKKPSDNHKFDKLCAKYDIEHCLIKPKTNGMVERFNGRIKHIIQTIKFENFEELKQTLMNYLYTYNNLLPQRALKGKTPVETLVKYYETNPELFKINPANLTEPDIWRVSMPWCNGQTGHCTGQRTMAVTV
jgi:transposase-like protein